MPRRGITQWMTDTDEYVVRHVYALEDRAITQLYYEYNFAFARLRAEAERLFARAGTEEMQISDPWFIRRNAVLASQIAAELTRLGDISNDITLNAAVDAYRAFYYGKAWQMDVLTGGRTNIPVLPAEMIRAQVLTPYQGQTFIERFAGNRDEFVAKLQRALIQSQIEGASITEMSRAIALELGIQPGQDRSPSNQRNIGLFNRAAMIARTETIRSSALGAVAIYERNKDVLKGWIWRATNDERTCPECGPLDGEEILFSDKSKKLPPLHPQCRCAVVPLFQDDALETELRARRPTFTEWAQARGMTENTYGQAFNFRAAPPPRAVGERPQ